MLRSLPTYILIPFLPSQSRNPDAGDKPYGESMLNPGGHGVSATDLYCVYANSCADEDERGLVGIACIACTV